MKILAIDPGNASGWALFHDSTYIESGVCCGDPQQVEALQYMCQVLMHADPDLLVIETQFGMPGRGTKNLVTLLERRFAWEILARLRCCRVHRVVPSTWQAHFKLLPEKARSGSDLTKTERGRLSKERREKIKENIIRAARKLTRNKAIQEDEADAVMLGAYALYQIENGKLNPKPKRKRCRKKKKSPKKSCSKPSTKRGRRSKT